MIIFEGKEYDKIRKFDCHILDFDRSTGGGYCTVLPISPIEYRQKTPDRDFPDKVEIVVDEAFTHFAITDDWGVTVTVSVGNEHAAEIELAMSAAREQGLYA